MSKFRLVEDFIQEVLGIDKRILSLQEEDEFRLSHHQLSEEVKEYLDACEQSDFIGAVDALVDLNVFLLGVAYKMGLDSDTYHKCFEAVMHANMEKKIGVKKGREGYKSKDAVKPENWVAPEERIAEILNEKINNN